MKSVICFFLAVAIIFVLYFASVSNADAEPADQSESSQKNSDATSYVPLNYEVPKAMWLSQFDMCEIYTSGGAQRDVTEYTHLVRQVIENISSIGINTVYVQLRPNGDSIYPSEIFPASKYAVGEYGLEHKYDPFEIFLELSHKADISVHAWINPLRLMSAESVKMISEKYTVKQWYLSGSYIKEVDGYLYLDPAYKEARELICSGVSEITEKYNIDGVHIDDYFYPTTAESFDEHSYASLNPQGLSLGDFRRQSTSLLVSSIHDTVKQKNTALLFGVSPSGNTERNYNELFADVQSWCASGYVDYLAPQIYFGFEHATRPFDKVYTEFLNMTRNTNVTLVAGITLEKAANGYSGLTDKWAGTGEREWIEQKNIIKRSLLYVRELDDTSGIALFSYRLLFDTLTGEQKAETREEYEGFLPVLLDM